MDKNNSNNNFDAFLTLVSASRQASQKGDLKQAERLLKISLKMAEEQLFSIQTATKEVVECLAELYEAQGREEEVYVLQKRLQQLEGMSDDDGLSIDLNNLLPGENADE
jgi:nitric oxide reductase activation protein